MVCGSPGSARGISGRRISLNPGPISMSSTRVNHGRKLATGNWAKQIIEGPKWACGRGGFVVRQGKLRLCMVLSVPKCVGGYENGGALFIGACNQLKRPLKAKEPKGATFRYYRENLVLCQLFFCKIKTKII